MAYFIYKYFIKNELVYIGKTSVGPYERYNQHVKDESSYDKVDRIDVCECESAIDMDVLELLLIAKYRPVWNVVGADRGNSSFAIPPLHFESYSISSFKEHFAANSNNQAPVCASSESRNKGKRLRRKFIVDGRAYWVQGYSREELEANTAKKKKEIELGKRPYASNPTLRRWAADWFSTQRLLHQSEPDALTLIESHQDVFVNLVEKKLGGKPIRKIRNMDLTRALLDIRDDVLQAEARALIECIFEAAYMNELIEDQRPHSDLLGRMTKHKDVIRNVHCLYLGKKPAWCHDYQE